MTFSLSGAESHGPETASFYAEHGYVVLQDVLKRDEIDEVRERVDGMLAGRYPARNFRVGMASNNGPDDPGRLIQQVVNLTLPVDDPVLGAFADHPRLRELACRFAGTSGLMVFQQQALIKAAGYPNGTPWHQDNGYWKLEAPAITVWIPLEPVTEGGGTLTVVPGSHRGPLLPHVRADGISNFHTCRDHVNDADGVEVVPPLGGTSFHDKMTVHGARPNLTDRRRIALAQHYTVPEIASRMKPAT